MAVSSGFIKILAHDAIESLEVLAQLKCARDNVRGKIIESDGTQVVSGSGNGLNYSVAMGAKSMTITEWYEALGQAISIAENKGKFRNRARIQF